MNNKLHYLKQADYFEEALPIGNGSLGAMVYGGTHTDKISLNHENIWSGTPERKIKYGAKESYEKAKTHMQNGDAAAAENEITNGMHTSWSQSYLPMGTLNITSSSETNVCGYERTLDMENGVAYVKYESSGVFHTREYLVSHPDDCVAVNIKDSTPCDYLLEFKSPLKYTISAENNMLVIKGECPSNSFPHDLNADVPHSYDGNSITFTTVIRVNTDGKVPAGNNKLSVKSSSSAFVFICTETSFTDHNTTPVKETEKTCKEKITAVAENTFTDIKNRHTEDFSSFYRRTSINLTEERTSADTGEILKNNYKTSADYAYLAELTFNFAKYL